MKFAKYVVRRLLQMIPVILAVTILNFLIINCAPGDPVTVLAGENASQAYMDELREAYGLNESMPKRLVIYLGKLVQGDLGESYTYKKPVSEIIGEKMKVTLLLVLLSEVATIVVGTLLGAFAARREGKWQDTLISNGSMMLYCMPVYWLGMLLILLFAVKLRWLPSSGMYSFGVQQFSKTVDLIRHLILPATALFLVHLPTYIKLTRSSVVEVAQEDYINTARAIGYSEKVVYRKHALRNALLPTVTMAGMSLSTVFSGALLTETVFSWPGIGRLCYTAITQKNTPMVLACTLIFSVCFSIVNLAVDILYAYIDPRIKSQFK